MATPKGVSNNNEIVKNALAAQIKTEKNFATQVYAKFNSIKFGIDSCCYTDYVSAVLSKSLCDWQNASSDKVVASTDVNGVFVEPLAKINKKASMACPATPSNVCTIVNLKELLGGNTTFTQCFEVASTSWTITHLLGRYPSVTVVDGQNEIVVADIDYVSSQQLTITFSIPFAGCAFLN
tara:strand:- start:2 stop:541 length:540 start_codon:yes stop_codon:yes gene_type:complete